MVIFAEAIKKAPLIEGAERSMGLKGPFMKYFYENMERMQLENWWILDDVPSMIVDIISEDNLSEKLDKADTLNPIFIASSLCYNLREYLPCLTPDFGLSAFGLLLAGQVVLRYGKKPISREQFLAHYHGSYTFNASEKEWNPLWRQHKQDTLGRFRQNYHEWNLG
jgi:hypothetical protein